MCARFLFMEVMISQMQCLQQQGRYKNAVLLYRYADVCLSWVKSKEIPRHKPIFLLVNKVSSNY